MLLAHLLTRCLPVLGLTTLLLSAGCTKKEQPIPAEPEAPLEGRWQQGIVYYTYTNSQGQRTTTGIAPAPAPAVFATLDATTWKHSGQNTNEYFYLRTDSVITRFWLNNNQPVNERYSILELTPHRLVLRSTLGPMMEGGYWQNKHVFTR